MPPPARRPRWRRRLPRRRASPRTPPSSQRRRPASTAACPAPPRSARALRRPRSRPPPADPITGEPPARRRPSPVTAALGGVVDGVDNTTGPRPRPPVERGHRPDHRPARHTVKNTLNDVGGALGSPISATSVNDTVRRASATASSAARASRPACSAATRRSLASAFLIQRSAIPCSSASCWAERWWPPGQHDQLARLGGALVELLASSSDGICSSPSAWSRSSGWPAQQLDRLAQVVLAEPGLERRRERARTARHLERPRARARAAGAPRRPGRSRSPRRSLGLVAAPWIAMKPPMLEPRTQIALRRRPPRAPASRRAILATSPSAAGDISSAASPRARAGRRRAPPSRWRRRARPKSAWFSLREPAPWTITSPGQGGGESREPEQVRAPLGSPVSRRAPSGLVAVACSRRCGRYREPLRPCSRRPSRSPRPAARTTMSATRRRRRPTRFAGSAVYPIGSRVNERGHLEVGGCDVVELAREFGTPAYIYAEDDIRARARAYLDALSRPHRRLRGRSTRARRRRSPRSTGCCARRGCRSTSPPGGELHMALRRRASTPRASTCTATTRPRPSCATRSRPASAT